MLMIYDFALVTPISIGFIALGILGSWSPCLLSVRAIERDMERD
jgi:hypothetical protein